MEVMTMQTTDRDGNELDLFVSRYRGRLITLSAVSARYGLTVLSEVFA